MGKEYLGIDIGGTAVKLGLVSEAGEVTAMTEASVSFDGYKTPILDTVINEAERFLEQENKAPGQLSAIGVSATGQIDSTEGIVAGTCGSLPGWAGTPIRRRLEEHFSLPGAVANDANCMCLGECWKGAAQGCTDVIGITVGTGIGGGILTGGRLLEGARGLGGEMGHLPLHALDGARCTCGNAGCWERYASTSALVRRAQKNGLPFQNGREIFSAAEKGDADALCLLDGWTDEIAAGLIGMVHIFNPQKILIGGGVSAQKKLLIEPLAEKVKSGVMPAFALGLEVCAAQLENAAGIVGAVRYAMGQSSAASARR
ncbi:MAG: ROK family protein [Faecalibacterium sp.]|jgi:glucokinase|nr:ROK family protein [Faecalibacterium sp.]